jgi:hypothetical protein
MEYFTFVYVKKTAGSMGIVMVDGDMSGFAIAFVPIIIYTHMISLNKIKKTYFHFSQNLLCYKNLKDHHKTGQQQASSLYHKEHLLLE